MHLPEPAELEAGLADIESQGIRELACLGNLVCYEAQLTEFIELLRYKSSLLKTPVGVVSHRLTGLDLVILSRLFTLP